jgi:hypothetical protein
VNVARTPSPGSQDLVLEPTAPPAPVALSVKQQNTADMRFNEAKKRVAEKLAKKKEQRAATRAAPAPRYDEVFYDGLEWLESLAGEPVSAGSASDATSV